MIEVFREQNSPEADWIEADLKDLAIGYECHILASSQVQDIFGMAVKLPVLRNGNRIASDREDILAFLNDIHKLVEDWRKFQVDSCYLDDDGETC
jgi:hypothetical protein